LHIWKLVFATAFPCGCLHHLCSQCNRLRANARLKRRETNGPETSCQWTGKFRQGLRLSCAGDGTTWSFLQLGHINFEMKSLGVFSDEIYDWLCVNVDR
jgi:hypothetical protein